MRHGNSLNCGEKKIISECFLLLKQIAVCEQFSVKEKFMMLTNSLEAAFVICRVNYQFIERFSCV
jgi:hypothetical protein